MSESNFLDISGRLKNESFQITKNATNPILISDDGDINIDFGFKNDDISSAKSSTLFSYEHDFNPETFLKEYDISEEDLKYATGEELFKIYNDVNYYDDKKYKQHNSMMITLLAGAPKETIQGFMNSFESATGGCDIYDESYDYSYDNLGKQLLYASRASDIIGQEKFSEFMETVKANPDLFPNYNEYAGIALGNQL